MRDCPKFRNFPRNASQNFTEYLGEWLEMNSRGESSKKAKTTNKRKNKTQVIFTCLESTDESKQRKQID
jgi:hypothetical protein